MRRREFILSTAGALLAGAGGLRADHHVLSADPLVVASDVISLQGRYTTVQDFYVRNHFSAPQPGSAVLSLTADRAASWQAASLDAGGSRFDWARWTVTLALNNTGVVELMSRATDSAGNSQPVEREPERVDRYAYNVGDRIRCVVV